MSWFPIQTGCEIVLRDPGSSIPDLRFTIYHVFYSRFTIQSTLENRAKGAAFVFVLQFAEVQTNKASDLKDLL